MNKMTMGAAALGGGFLLAVAGPPLEDKVLGTEKAWIVQCSGNAASTPCPPVGQRRDDTLYVSSAPGTDKETQAVLKAANQAPQAVRTTTQWLGGGAMLTGAIALFPLFRRRGPPPED